MDTAALLGALSAILVSLITGAVTFLKDRGTARTEQSKTLLERDRLYLDQLIQVLREKDAMIEAYRSEIGRLRSLLQDREG